PRLWAHQHPWATAVRRVVDRAVHVVGLVAQVVNPQLDVTALVRLAEQRYRQRTEVVRKDGDEIDPHQRSNNPSGGSITPRPAARSTDGTSSATNGTSASSAPSRSSTSTAGPGGCRTSLTVPRTVPDGSTAVSPIRSWSQKSSSSSPARLVSESATRKV